MYFYGSLTFQMLELLKNDIIEFMRNRHTCYINSYDQFTLFGKYSKCIVKLGEFWHYTI